MKKTFLFSFWIFIISNSLGQTNELPQSVITEFAYHFKYFFKYGSSDLLKSEIYTAGRRAGYSVDQVDILMENLETSSIGRELVFMATYELSYRHYDFVYANLKSLDMKASTTATIAKYISSKYGALYKKIAEEEQQKELKRKEEIEKQRKAEELRKKEEEERRKKKQAEIQSKTYDLKEIAPDDYKKVLESQRGGIKFYFSMPNILIPSFDELKKSKNKFVRFKNEYNVTYEIVNVEEPALMKATSISGTDSTCKLLQVCSIDIPTGVVEGYEVKTKCSFDANIDFTRGVTKVKVKNGKVSFKESIPERDIEDRLTSELINLPDGNYVIKFELGEIMGESIVFIQEM